MAYIRKTPPKHRPEERSKHTTFQMELYKYICENVPFITFWMVKNHFCSKYNYCKQHVYQELAKVVQKEYIRRGAKGYIELYKEAPVFWTEDNYNDTD